MVVLLILSIVALYFGQDLLIYQNNFKHVYDRYPGDNPQGLRNPKEKNMNFEDIVVITEDNVRLAGWFIRHDANDKAHPTIIYMQETWGNIGYKLPWAENIYHNLGANLVIVGYRGYGHSEGKPTEKGLELDAKAIIDFTLNNKKIDPLQVYVYGPVLGGAVALSGAQTYMTKIKGLILENTFTNMAAMVDDTYWIFRLLRPLILANYWPSDTRIQNTTTPILFISGTASDTNDDMHQLRDLAKRSIYTDFLEIPGGNKNDTWRVGGKNYLLSIDNFIIKTRPMVNIPLAETIRASNSTSSTNTTTPVSGSTSTNTTARVSA
jgi:fermentation-respiration switch protein FrsA (DUF1100 family)